MAQRLDEFHKTKPGFAVFGLVELALSYSFISLALNSGNLLDYTLAIALFIGFVQNLGKLIGMFIHGSKYKAD